MYQSMSGMMVYIEQNKKISDIIKITEKSLSN